MQDYQQIIEQAWEDRAAIQPGKAPAKVGEAVEHVLAQLDQGKLRVAEKIDGQWVTHQWIKKAVLLSFRLEDNRVIRRRRHALLGQGADQVRHYDAEQFERGGFRVVPAPWCAAAAFIGRTSC
jgi:2,3,4,5-tetrahydropyridine-2-carboxylate N-succinyltransferase